MATVYASKGYDFSPVFFGDKGNLACIVSTYEASSLAAGSVIRMCKIPANAVVVDGYVTCDALGSDVVLDVGDETNAALFKNDLAAGSAVTAARFDAGLPQSYDGEAWLQITTGSATSTPATGTITCVVFYVME